ncbi:MAG: putative bifunctional diguanylate cyclase/phosphodiesterase [Solirubrobacteraceae bacterium]
MTGPEHPEIVNAVAPASDGTFVEVVLGVQSLVSRCAPPAMIYQAVVDGALRLLSCDGGSLRFVDLEDPTWSVAVAWHGSAGQGERWRHRAPITEGLSGRVIATGKPAALEDYLAAQTGSQLAPLGTQAIIGIPIREDNRVIGSLVVGSTIERRHWTAREWELLLAYGEHVGVAVAVVRASHAVQQALTDSLTGLANRRLLLDRLQHELVRADRGGEPVSVLYMDLDGFKLVNDSLGHFVGDQLLVAVADRLRGCARDGDVCARLGGDEFAVLLAGQSDPVTIAERIIDVLGRRFRIAENDVFISVSVGIVSGREEAEALLRQADVAMYHAKRAGGSRYERFAPSMHAALVSRLKLGTGLRRAIEREEFELHYQPLFDLRSGRVTAFEGLIRWRHPTRGLVAPLDFIPVAEQTGMIVEIGRWVLQQGCSQLADWWRESPIALCLNVSTRELQQPGYTTAVSDAIHGAFPPSALILEVTEREPLEGVPGVLESLQAVNELGVRIALDDFGTGYCTLLNLSHMPVELLKIAKPFLDALGRDERNPAGLLAGIIGLGTHLGLTTVAEGIERPEQRALLIELGCDFGQGYLLGRPLDATGADRLLAAQARPGATVSGMIAA